MNSYEDDRFDELNLKSKILKQNIKELNKEIEKM